MSQPVVPAELVAEVESVRLPCGMEKCVAVATHTLTVRCTVHGPMGNLLCVEHVGALARIVGSGAPIDPCGAAGQVSIAVVSL